MADTIRVLVADDEWEYAKILALELREYPDLDVLDPVFSAGEAVAVAASDSPDVVLLDLQMGGVEACRRIKTSNPDITVLFVTVEDSTDSLAECRAAGANGYVVKRGPGDPNHVAAALRAAAQGAIVVDGISHPSESDLGLVSARRAETGGLTPRELEVLALLARGLTDKEIAGKLGISPHTVTNHVKMIRQKLDADTRGAAVAKARDQGIVR